MTIPERAVDAAHDAFCHLDIAKSDIEGILAAGAPYLWEVAYRAGHLDSATGTFRPWHQAKAAGSINAPRLCVECTPARKHPVQDMTKMPHGYVCGDHQEDTK